MREQRRWSGMMRVAVVLAAMSATVGARATEIEFADEDSPYALGTRAMNEHRWADAVTSFDQVIDGRAKRVDAALYWKAYSLNKLGNRPMALATCYQLRSHFGASAWNKDCSALSIDLRRNMQATMVAPAMPAMPAIPAVAAEMQGVRAETDALQRELASEDRESGRQGDGDLKILAVNSLLNRDPAQAMPILRGLLAGNQPDNVKQHAMFVLAQSRSPEAQGIFHDAVMGKMGVPLQRKAIEMSGIFQGKRANEGLAEVYRSTTDREVKRSVITAFFISQDAPRMVDLARSEKDMELKRSIVSQLALMQDKAATDYMMELLK